MAYRLAGPLLLALCFSGPASAQSYRPPQNPAMLIHGNYCGLGNNAPLPPIDALDAACARHDACTPNNGLPSRACNLRFQNEATFISRDPRQPDDLRALAGFLAASTAMIPSDPRPRGRATYGTPAGPYGWRPAPRYGWAY